MYILENTGELDLAHTSLLITVLCISYPKLGFNSVYVSCIFSGEFVRFHDLRIGDYMMLYIDDQSQKFVIP